jgi:hypothetical protein
MLNVIVCLFIINIITQLQVLGIGGAPVFTVGDTTLSCEGESSYGIIRAEDFHPQRVWLE